MANSKRLAGLLAVALVAAACGGGGTEGPEGEAQNTEAAGEVAPPETKPDKIIVRSWGSPWSEGILESAGASFTEETGIDVEIDTTDFAEIGTKVREAVDAGERPPVDVVYTISAEAELAKARGLTLPLDVENIVTNWSELASGGKPEDGSTNYVNVYSYTFPVIYNKDVIEPPEDFSWLDLFDPNYEGSFVVASGYDVLLFPLAKALGLDPATDDLTPVWDKLREFRPNVCGRGADVEFIQLIASGECKWGAFIVGNAFALEEAGVNVGWIVPKEGATFTTDAFYVPVGLPEDVTYWAQVFVNHVIDADNLEQWTQAVGTIPMNLNSEPLPELLGDPAFPFTEEEIEEFAIPVPLAITAENNDQWAAEYEAAISG